MVTPSQNPNTWVSLTTEELRVGEIYDWCLRDDCGAIVVFSGTVRDHAEHRTGVSLLEYEAYEEQVEPRLELIVDEMRACWPCLLYTSQRPRD